MSKDQSASYYDHGGVEVIEVVRAKLTSEQYKGWMLGQAITYCCRAQFKHAGSPQDEARDYEKAANYLKWLAEDVRKEVPPS